MENIIVNFTSDPSGLQPGIDGLVQLEIVDKDVAEQAKKTAAEFAKRDRAIKDGASQANSQIEKLSSSFKNLDKSIVGGAYNKALKQLQKEVEGASDEFTQLAMVIAFTKKEMANMSPDSTEWRELNKQVQAGEALLKSFGEEEEKTAQKATTFKARLRELKNEMQALEDQGKEDSAEFRNMAIEAARLEDQIGDTQARIRAMASDTANMDAAVSGIQALASGYQIAQGATALFGDESEDMQKALVKLNAIMAITNGIREIQLVLQNQSILRLKLEAVGQAILAGSTRLTAAAFSMMGISVNATATSFKVLRGAIIATGIGALVVGVGMLIEKMGILDDSTNDAAEAQDKLNKEFDEWIGKIDALDEMDRLMRNRQKDGIDNLKREVDLLKSQGAEKDKIFSKEQELRNAEKRDLQGRLALNKMNLEDAIARGVSEDKINELKKQGLLLDKERLDKESEITAAAADRQQQIREESKRAEEERKRKAKEAADRAKEERENGFREHRAYLQQQLLGVEEGSREELKIKKQLRLNELQMQLDALANDAAHMQQRKALVKQYHKEVKEMQDEYYRQVQEDAISGRVAQINAQLAELEIQSVGENNQQLLQLKQDLIDEQADLEILGIEHSVQNEELRRQKILAVYARALADKKKLEQEKNRTEIDEGLKESLSVYDEEIGKLQLVLNSTKATGRQKREAQDKYFQYVSGRISAEQLANQQAYDAGLISYNAYLQKKRALDQQYRENQQKEDEAAENRKTMLRDLAVQTSVNLTNALFNFNKSKYAEDEARLKELYDNKKITETEYSNQMKLVRKKQAEDEKAQALFTTLVNQGPMLIKGFKEGGLAGVGAALTLFFAILSTVTSTKVPQFYKGTKKAPKGFKWVGEKGPELINDQGGYPIIPHEKSVKLASSGYADQAILKEYNIPMPKVAATVSMPVLPEYVQTVSHHHKGAEIDYQKLGDVIAQKLAENPQHVLSIDEQGFMLSVKTGNDQITYKNKKITS